MNRMSMLKAQHVNVKSTTCQFQNCRKRPNFGDPINKIALFCAEHANFKIAGKDQILDIQLIK